MATVVGARVVVVAAVIRQAIQCTSGDRLVLARARLAAAPRSAATAAVVARVTRAGVVVVANRCRANTFAAGALVAGGAGDVVRAGAALIGGREVALAGGGVANARGAGVGVDAGGRLAGNAGASVAQVSVSTGIAVAARRAGEVDDDALAKGASLLSTSVFVVAIGDSDALGSATRNGRGGALARLAVTSIGRARVAIVANHGDADAKAGFARVIVAADIAVIATGAVDAGAVLAGVAIGAATARAATALNAGIDGARVFIVAADRLADADARGARIVDGAGTARGAWRTIECRVRALAVLALILRTWVVIIALPAARSTTAAARAVVAAVSDGRVLAGTAGGVAGV